MKAIYNFKFILVILEISHKNVCYKYSLKIYHYIISKKNVTFPLTYYIFKINLINRLVSIP